MKVQEAKYSILEIRNWFRDRTLTVNKEYQRSSGLWPPGAKSYFIDSILRDFPFPKVYFHERVDRVEKRPHREIVDGQQRITTIVAFSDDEFALSKNAREFAGKRFSDFTQDEQDKFWAYTVSVDVIRNADRVEILQMFRRMNAYTLPLNAAEKRHSEFFGDFKDWANRTLDRYGSVLVDWKVFTSRQVVRMADAEFLTDLALAVKEGVVSTSPSKLTQIYRDYENTDASLDPLEDCICGAFDEVLKQLSGIQGSHAVKPHLFHSLLCAMIHNKFGLPGFTQKSRIKPIGQWLLDSQRSLAQVRQLAEAYEVKDIGRFEEFVKASTEGGNRAAQREVRVKWFCLALQGNLP